MGEEVIASGRRVVKVGNLNDPLNYMIHPAFTFLLRVFSKRSIYKITAEHLSSAGEIRD